ncbi:MAG: CDP-alcohol phosphatidyltransferase family protein [Geminicoccaceae bacterium]
MAVATGGGAGGAVGDSTRAGRHALSAIGAHLANVLTVARLCSAVPLVLLVRAGAFPEAAGLFLVAALSDGLDGFVAKRFGGITQFGTVLDPVADKVLMASLFLTLALTGHLPVWIVALILARDVLIVVGTLVLRCVHGRFRVEPLLVGKASTLMQILLGGAVLAQLSVLPQLAAWLTPLLLLTAVTVLASAVAYLRAASRIWVSARAPQ